MKEGGFENVAKRLQSIDAVFAASLYFGLDRNNHTLSLGLLICWIGIRCSQQIWKVKNNENWAEETIPCTIIFGLTAFHARSIIQLDDRPGGSIYILIAALMYLGSLYSIPQRKKLLRWTSAAALGFNLKILLEGYSSGLNLFGKLWMVEINNNVHSMGFGRINSLASMIAFCTIIAFYGLRTDRSVSTRVLHAGTMVSGLFLCWQSSSEMALAAPLLSATASSLACRKDYFKKKTPRNYTLALIWATTITSIFLTWRLAFQDKFLRGLAIGEPLAEGWRLEQWNCWLKNSIFAGNNKIMHGIGFNIQEITRLCGNNNPDGGFTQFISQHGLLGALAAVLLLTLTTKSIFKLRQLECNSAASSQLTRCRWSEVAIGTITTVLLCNSATSSYSASYLNASLTGLIFSLGLYSYPIQKFKP